MSHLDIAIIAGFVIALIAIGRLRNIDRVNRALAKGRAEEAEYAWELHVLYLDEKKLRAEGQMMSGEYQRTVAAIRQIHAGIADVYEMSTRNTDKVLARMEKEEAWKAKHRSVAPADEQG